MKVLDSYKEKQEGDRVTMGDKVVRLKRELKYQGTILKIYEDTVLANGHEAHWDFIHHDGAAAVVPVTDDGKILMVRQYRNALNRETLEIPAGKLDAPDEPKIECAYRELEEETGVKELPLEQFAVYGDYDRDPRTRVITTAYLSLVNEQDITVRAGDDAADAAWCSLCLKEKEVHTGEVSRKVWQLHVSNEEKGLDTRAEVEETCREGLIRERKFQVLTGGEIAVDHAAIIVQAMCILADRLLEKR